MLKDRINNLLVVRTDRFGEFILNIPAIRALKDTFRTAKISVLASDEVSNLMRGSNLADSFLFCNGLPRRGAFYSIRLGLWLKRRRFDAIVIFNPSKQFNIAAFLAGIRIRAGYDRKCGFLLNYKIPDRKSEAVKHEVLYNMELVRAIGAYSDNLSINIPVSQQARDYIDSLFEKLGVSRQDKKVAVHPFTSDPRKQWHIDNFKELSLLLRDKYGVKVFIIGGRAEASTPGPIDLADRGVFNLIGALRLEQSAALLKQCLLLISCDSGPVHLASSQGTKTCVLFRNDSPGKGALRWGPWGEGHRIIQDSDLNNITPQRVIDTVGDLFGGEG